MDEIILLLFFATGMLIVVVFKLKTKLNQLKVRFLNVRRQISGVRKEAITAKKTAANLLKLLDDAMLERRLSECQFRLSKTVVSNEDEWLLLKSLTEAELERRAALSAARAGLHSRHPGRRVGPPPL